MSDKSNKKIVLWVSLLIGLPLFAYILATLDIAQARNIAQAINLWYLLFFLLFSVLTLIIYTVVWRMFLRSHNPDFSLPMLTLFNYRMAGFAVSYTTPGPRIGGEATQGSLLSQDSTVGQKEATMAAVMEKFSLFVTGLLFDTVVIVVALISLPQSWLLQSALIVLFVLALIIGGGWYTFVAGTSGKNVLSWLAEYFNRPEYQRVIQESHRSFQDYARSHRHVFFRSVAVNLLTKASMVMQMYTLLAALSTPVSILEAIFIAAAVDVAYSIPSYMGLGALEAGQVGILGLIGKNTNAGVPMAFLMRVRDIGISGYGFICLMFYTSNNAEKSVQPKRVTNEVPLTEQTD